VNELAKESEGDVKYPFESLGKKEAIDPICLDHAQYKGNLHYVAEFVPAVALRGVEFESGPNALQQAADGGGSDAETVDTASASSVEGTIPRGITTSSPLGAEEEMDEDKKTHVKGAKSTDTTATVDTTATNGTREASPTAETKMEKEEAGVAMTNEELLKQRMYRLIINTLFETNYSIVL
jgi:hypothetical protein